MVISCLGRGRYIGVGERCDRGQVRQSEGGRVMSTKKSVVFLLSVFALGFALPEFVQRADAQVLYGSVSGSITDQSGAGVPKAHVVATNKATNVKREADADETGHYLISDLPPGEYDLSVKANGFKPVTLTNLRWGANPATNADARLEVGTMAQEVMVEASAVTLQTEKTDLHTEL